VEEDGRDAAQQAPLDHALEVRDELVDGDADLLRRDGVGLRHDGQVALGGPHDGLVEVVVGLALDVDRLDDLGGVVGDVLLEPTRLYTAPLLRVLANPQTGGSVHALSHVTGGGIPGNLVRVLPEHLDAVVDRATWRPQPIFDLISRAVRVTQSEMDRTFNLGIGMVVALPAAEVDRAIATFSSHRLKSWTVGEITTGRGMVRLVGEHPA